MNDKVAAEGAEEFESDTSAAAPAPESQPQTAGAALRQLRESRGAELVQLAAVLKVRPEKLAALEADRYDQLPDMVFVRALTQSICRLFEVDSKPLLALLPAADSPHLSRDSEGLNQTFKISSVNHGSSTRLGNSPSMGYAALIVIFLLVGAGVIYFWPHVTHLLGKSSGADENVVELSTDAQSPLNTATGQMIFPVAAAPDSATGATGAANAVANTGVSNTVLPLPAGLQSSAAVAGAADPAGVASVAPAVTEVAPQDEPDVQPDTLRIVAKEAVWIQVRDGANALLRQATLPKGQELVLTQAPPLRVEIGRVDGVDVFVNGQPFDLAPYARSNVARFTIQP